MLVGTDGPANLSASWEEVQYEDAFDEAAIDDEFAKLPLDFTALDGECSHHHDTRDHASERCVTSDHASAAVLVCAASSQAALGHAMARAARVLLAASAGDEAAQVDESSYEPFVARASAGNSSAASEAASLASRAAHAAQAAQAAQAAAHNASRRCAELQRALHATEAEASLSTDRVRIATARAELLASQLAEVETEAASLEADSTLLGAMTERRREAQREEQRTLEEVVRQVAEERGLANETLAEARAQCSGAQKAARALEAVAAAGVVPQHGETLGESAVRHTACVGQLDCVRQQAHEASTRLVAMEAEEKARESTRCDRLHTAQCVPTTTPSPPLQRRWTAKGAPVEA